MAEVLAKYRRKVFVVPVEKYPVIDRRGRLQLGSKRTFLTEGLGLGSFCKTMHEKGHFQGMRSRGVKYVYLQPLTNAFSGIIDFDMLDIMLSTSQLGASKMLGSQFASNQSMQSIRHVNTARIPSDTSIRKAVRAKRQDSNRVQIFGSSDMDLPEGKSPGLRRDRSQRAKVQMQGQARMSTSIDSEWTDELRFDCIAKIFDLEGDLALKVHDAPSDCLNSVKFFDPERGTNWSKLHSGEAVFSLERFLSSRFWQNYNHRGLTSARAAQAGDAAPGLRHRNAGLPRAQRTAAREALPAGRHQALPQPHVHQQKRLRLPGGRRQE